MIHLIKHGESYWWNGFDVSIELFLNRFAGRYPWLDSLVSWGDNTPLIKGGVIVLLMWLLLFDRKRPGQLRSGSEILLGAGFVSAFATVAARGLALILPFRTRPFVTPALHFHLPIGATTEHIDWSSFPSDHAALFFALAAGVFLVSRPAGYLAIFWSAFAICLPRLYLGQHWPTDILVGAALGILAALAVRVSPVRDFFKRWSSQLHQKRPELFFALLFLWSYETIILFGDVRHILKVVVHAI